MGSNGDYSTSSSTEVKARIEAEIRAIPITPEEKKIIHEQAEYQFQCKIYHLSRQENGDFKAPKESLKVLGK